MCVCVSVCRGDLGGGGRGSIYSVKNGLKYLLPCSFYWLHDTIQYYDDCIKCTQVRLYFLGYHQFVI